MEPSRLLIFIVAYNAERHIEKVLDRIPKEKLNKYDYEILIIDDQSKDSTFERALAYQKAHPEINLTVLYNPQNQGYGGNQKLGYHYAKIHQFDVVLLLHGDGQYAPEEFDRLVLPIVEGDADAVFGSRMLNKKDALKGKMPYYKFVGNIILTKMQNRILHTNLSEFHSGYRAYRVNALNRLPIERNSNDFHFDTQIIIQLVMGKMKIHEVPIPTHYGDEICYVNGMEYAYNIIKASIHSRLQQMGIFYKREYDLDDADFPYQLKLGYMSSHTMAIAGIEDGSKVLDIGAGKGLIARELLKKGCKVTGLDQLAIVPLENFTDYIQLNFDNQPLDLNMDQYNYIIALDIIEHLSSPEAFLDQIRFNTRLSKTKIILTTPNIGFIIVRLQLLFGGFNYGKKGILDYTHKRLFTFKSLKRLCEQSGYKVKVQKGVPAPFPVAIGNNWLSRFLLEANRAFIGVRKSLFAYQIYAELEPLPMVEHLMKYTMHQSEEKRKNIVNTANTIA
ncbi:MAG: glycosyltransferase [Saprospiraceae bacterium]|nr:glycosyltransferase [Saprospiraceae bacterium]